jgi:hypothetical protein
VLHHLHSLNAYFNNGRNSTPTLTIHAFPYASYQPYDDDQHLDWHTKDSLPCNSVGEVMESTAPQPESSTTKEVPMPVQEVQVSTSLPGWSGLLVTLTLLAALLDRMVNCGGSTRLSNYGQYTASYNYTE